MAHVHPTCASPPQLIPSEHARLGPMPGPVPGPVLRAGFETSQTPKWPKGPSAASAVTRSPGEDCTAPYGRSHRVAGSRPSFANLALPAFPQRLVPAILCGHQQRPAWASTPAPRATFQIAAAGKSNGQPAAHHAQFEQDETPKNVHRLPYWARGCCGPSWTDPSPRPTDCMARESDETAIPQTHNSWSWPRSIALSVRVLRSCQRAPSTTALHTLSCILGLSGTADLGRDMGLETSSELPW
jgi:hypothetical protein